MDYKFKIAIGDWSGDGHRQCQHFVCTANKPIEDIREAYFSAKKSYPKISPEEFCNDYEDGLISSTQMSLIQEVLPLTTDELGFEEDGPGSETGYYGISEEFMLQFVVEFLKLGDPELEITCTPGKDLPMLQFSGYDEKKRHIGFIGYGLFY